MNYKAKHKSVLFTDKEGMVAKMYRILVKGYLDHLVRHHPLSFDPHVRARHRPIYDLQTEP